MRKPKKIERPWPASEIVTRPISALSAHAKNARQHSDSQIGLIVNSMKAFGFTVPILIDEHDTILAGHGRVMAAERLGFENVPAMVARGWSDAEKRAYLIADNELTLRGSWDEGLLRMELAELHGIGFDIGLTGFTVADLEGMGDTGPAGDSAKLSERFMVAPFSVLNAREGWWQERKRAWLALGIQSELGRGDTAVNSPHEGKGMADGHEAVRAKQKKANAAPGGSSRSMGREEYKTGRYKGSKDRAAPGGSKMPAADYSKRQRGDGRGRPAS